jgi:transaldolase
MFLEILKDLKIKIFADVASEKEIIEYASKDYIKGFTTNPSLLRKSGITNYKDFALNAINHINGKSISFEVISDNEEAITSEALKINSWGGNVFVKIPFLKTDGSNNLSVIKNMIDRGVKLNITAVFTIDQVKSIAAVINNNTPIIISIFAGRIADTGVDPKPLMIAAKELTKAAQNCHILWASAREIFSVIEAQNCQSDIITLPSELLTKFKLWGMDLNEYSRKTSETFYQDAKTAGLVI